LCEGIFVSLLYRVGFVFVSLHDVRSEVASEAHSEQLNEGYSKNSESYVLGVRVHEIIDGVVASFLEAVFCVGTVLAVDAARWRWCFHCVVLPVGGFIDTTAFQNTLQTVDRVTADFLGFVAVFAHAVLELIFDGVGDTVLVVVDSNGKSDLADEDDGDEAEVEQKHAPVLGQRSAASQQSDYKDNAAEGDEEESGCVKGVMRHFQRLQLVQLYLDINPNSENNSTSCPENEVKNKEDDSDELSATHL